MRNRPSAIELLEAARAAVADRLVAHLPEAMQDEGLRVAQAIDIVRRGLEAESAGPDGVRTMLVALYGDDGADIGVLAARLARDLRNGVLDVDGPERELAFDVLREMTARKLAEDNPDYPR